MESIYTTSTASLLAARNLNDKLVEALVRLRGPEAPQNPPSSQRPSGLSGTIEETCHLLNMANIMVEELLATIGYDGTSDKLVSGGSPTMVPRRL